jgi:transcriptional regulator with XRE-family HTH domain
MNENCHVIIDTLIEQRHIKGMTQKELAKTTSLTQSVIARLENKKVTPQLDTLLKVAYALGCDIAVVPTDK